MRTLLALVSASPLLGAGACGVPAKTAPSGLEHAQELIVGIANDMRAIAASFSGGLDNPHDPVNDPLTLKQDQDRLAAATAKARELMPELEKLQHGDSGGR